MEGSGELNGRVRPLEARSLALWHRGYRACRFDRYDERREGRCPSPEEPGRATPPMRGGTIHAPPASTPPRTPESRTSGPGRSPRPSAGRARALPRASRPRSRRRPSASSPGGPPGAWAPPRRAARRRVLPAAGPARPSRRSVWVASVDTEHVSNPRRRCRCRQSCLTVSFRSIILLNDGI